MQESDLHPVSLEKDRDRRELVVHWNDGVSQRIRYRQLRDQCPCAHCIDKRMKGPETKPMVTGVLPVLSAAEVQPLDIVSMKPIGNYAYGIQFSDGHSSGIFSMGYLRSIQTPDDPELSNSGTS